MSAIPKFPIIVFLQLLEKPLFLNNSELMETLMQTLSIIMRSLASLIKKASLAQQQDSSAMDVDAGKKAEEAKTASGDIEMKDVPKEEPQAPKFVYKPPDLSPSQLRNIVVVLTAGECSNKAFQYTLSIIQNLSNVEEYKKLLLEELISSAQHIANGLAEDLDKLRDHMTSLQENQDVDTDLLTVFSSPSSQQTKLLRVHKTIDFLHSKLDSQISDTTKSEGDEKELLEIYSKLNLGETWKKLGECLTSINKDDKYSHVATVLLPLIEAFMVVMKPYVSKHLRNMNKQSKEIHQEAGISAEDMFFAFTEEHKKLLNSMVRNNPSLMNGSFGLLVHNPKVLEFDNKRTYFNQQLHKRKRREHYDTINLNVRRQYVFEDSYHQMQGRPGSEIKFGKLAVKFHDEEGVDAGGVTREWFSVLARQMFNPDYALFKPSAGTI
jgi:E3 ubiquitin-protein ligase HUWE1